MLHLYFLVICFFFCIKLSVINTIIFQIPPPWKPEVKNTWDTKYIPDEFASEPLDMSPSDGFPSHKNKHRGLNSIAEDSELPYFEQFSYHGGSRNVYGSYLNAANSAIHHTDETF